MKGGKTPFGYTIIEVLIVLAVSGFLFVIASTFISGKQERTSFQQASYDFSTQIQAIIDQVTNGEYTDIPFTCSKFGSNLKFNGALTTTQGTNQECVFLGKIIHLSEGGNRNKYEVFSIAGARENSGVPITDLANSLVTAIDDPSAARQINLTKKLTTPQNIDVVDVKNISALGSTSNDYAFGFLQSLGSLTTTNGVSELNSGSQTINSYYIGGVNSNKMEQPTVSRINQPNAGGFHLAKSVCIAISDGTRGALVTIGDRSDQLNVSLKQLGLNSSPSCP